MTIEFEELDYRQTPWGEISLRRRTDPQLGNDLYEVKLGDEFLMSSRFTEGEIALARLGLAPLREEALDVVVGGLGLGYTAQAVLDEPRVCSMLVVDALAPVIDWHRRGLVPLGKSLSADSRCEFINGDFFALVETPSMDSRDPYRRFHAILVDIDHSPRHVLNESHRRLYSEAGLTRLAQHLHPGGVFALWSNDPPDEAFLATLARVFPGAEARVVTFHNPLQDRAASNTVYVAMRGLRDG